MNQSNLERIFANLDSQLCKSLADKTNGIIGSPRGFRMGVYEDPQAVPETFGVYTGFQLADIPYFQSQSDKIDAYYQQFPHLEDHHFGFLIRFESEFIIDRIFGHQIVGTGVVNESLTEDEKKAVLSMFAEKYPAPPRNKQERVVDVVPTEDIAPNLDDAHKLLQLKYDNYCQRTKYLNLQSELWSVGNGLAVQPEDLKLKKERCNQTLNYLEKEAIRLNNDFESVLARLWKCAGASKTETTPADYCSLPEMAS